MLSRTLLRTATLMASRAGVSSARVISSTMRSSSSVVLTKPILTGVVSHSTSLRSFASATSSTANSSSSAAGMSAAAAAVKTTTVDAKTPDMFCFQCEQTDQGTGCTKIGVCGKTPETAALQDALVEAIKHISVMARNIRSSNKTLNADAQETLRMTDRFVLDALFSTLTNVNFDADRFVQYMQESTRVFQQLEGLHRTLNLSADRSVQQSWNDRVHATKFNKEALVQLGKDVGVLPHRAALNNADIHGLIEMCMYGIKGAAAYAHHALVNGVEDAKTYMALENALARLANPSELTVPDLLGLALEIGGINLQVMENLDKSSTKRWGNPEPTQVSLDPVPGKAILVSGHDLVDLEEILKQTEGTGINVYTHGEMLPGHSYPGLKKYKHLAGHYGGAWQLQKFDFGTFPGAIVMTSNCIIEPRKSYKNRIFTRQMVGWPGVVHIPGDKPDFSPAIKAAQEAPGFVTAGDSKTTSTKQQNNKTLTIGFGHHTVLSIADKVVDAVKKGQISRFFLIGGCDGSESERSYFSELAKAAPQSSVILTLGCGKFRVNQLGLGDIGGIPRVLDMGQCNDSYSAIQVAVALAKAFNTDVNSLPLSMAISWFEQKAVAVLLTLLHLGVKNIRLGPALPAFVTPSVLNILVEKFAIKPIGKVKDDLPKMLMNQ